MKFHAIELQGVYVIDLQPFRDERGFFSRIYCKKEFAEAGLVSEFVQINHSITTRKGTIRGMHYQVPPHAEVKVIRCVKGGVLDVVVDIRRNSPTFLKHFKIELTEENDRMLYIPRGFAHGFQTIEDDAALIYQHSDFYMPSAEQGIRYNDPLLEIDWPLTVNEISLKDRNHQFLSHDFEGIET